MADGPLGTDSSAMLSQSNEQKVREQNTSYTSVSQGDLHDGNINQTIAISTAQQFMAC